MRTAALVLLILIGCGGDMQRISDLATGYDDAPSGYVEVKLKGTSTNATIYGDPDGLSALTGPQYTLDSNGALEAYANALVDIYVYTSAGTLVRGARTIEGGSTNVVYSGQSALGVTPVTGVIAANQPIPLNTYLDRWLTSAGARDWYVQKDVASTPATWSLKSLGVSVGTAFINVKDPAYGAKGDGTTNDLTAIQNAINAAQTAGGGIILVPAGSYTISGSLTISSPNVTVMGIGSPIVKSTSSSANAFTVTAARTVIRDIGIEVALSVGSNSTGYAISATGASDSSFDNVWISRTSSTYLFSRGLSVVSSSRVSVSGGYHYASAYGQYWATATSDSNSVSGCTLIRGMTAGIYIGNQSNFNLSSCPSVYGNTDSINGVSSTFVVISGVTFSSGGIRTDSGCAGWRESGSYSPTWTNIDTTGGGHRFSSAPVMGPTIASAATLSLSQAPLHRVYRVSGTTNITAISVPAGLTAESDFIVTLIFDGALTVTDGGSLKMAGNLNTAANTSLTLLLDRVNGWWIELGRSVN